MIHDMKTVLALILIAVVAAPMRLNIAPLRQRIHDAFGITRDRAVTR
jgi:hypothetical protein